MDPISTLLTVINIARAIHAQLEQTLRNRSDCLDLAGRMTGLMTALDACRANRHFVDLNGALFERLLADMKRAQELVESIAASASGGPGARLAASRAFFGAGSDAQQIAALNARISQHVLDLQPGIAAANARAAEEASNEVKARLDKTTAMLEALQGLLIAASVTDSVAGRGSAGKQGGRKKGKQGRGAGGGGGGSALRVTGRRAAGQDPGPASGPSYQNGRGGVGSRADADEDSDDDDDDDDYVDDDDEDEDGDDKEDRDEQDDADANINDGGPAGGKEDEEKRRKRRKRRRRQRAAAAAADGTSASSGPQRTGGARPGPTLGRTLEIAAHQFVFGAFMCGLAMMRPDAFFRAAVLALSPLVPAGLMVLLQAAVLLHAARMTAAVAAASAASEAAASPGAASSSSSSAAALDIAAAPSWLSIASTLASRSLVPIQLYATPTLGALAALAGASFTGLVAVGQDSGQDFHVALIGTATGTAMYAVSFLAAAAR